jgi:casein kinase II subunit alpha
VYEGVFNGFLPVAVKVIERGSDKHVAREIALLTTLRNCPNIIHMHEAFQKDSAVLVFEKVKGMTEEHFLGHVTIERFRFVLKCLFEALAAAHEHNIVHRDVKLGNMLISDDWSQVRLIDWGCGTVIKDKMSSRAGARSVRSIEMMLGYEGYGTLGDMWAMGAFICSTLCGGTVPWKSSTSAEALIQMAAYFGRRSVVDLARRLHLDMDDSLRGQILGVPSKRLSDAYARFQRRLRDPLLIDLMHRLMTVLLEERYSATDALNHPFFKDGRQVPVH